MESWAARAGRQLPRAEDVAALIDTGAAVTGVDESLVRSIGLPPVGTAKLMTASGDYTAEVYAVRLVIDGARVVSVRLGGQPYRVLIGRDVLRLILMTYNGFQAQVTLGY